MLSKRTTSSIDVPACITVIILIVVGFNIAILIIWCISRRKSRTHSTHEVPTYAQLPGRWSTLSIEGSLKDSEAYSKTWPLHPELAHTPAGGLPRLPSRATASKRAFLKAGCQLVASLPTGVHPSPRDGSSPVRQAIPKDATLRRSFDEVTVASAYSFLSAPVEHRNAFVVSSHRSTLR